VEAATSGLQFRPRGYESLADDFDVRPASPSSLLLSSSCADTHTHSRARAHAWPRCVVVMCCAVLYHRKKNKKIFSRVGPPSQVRGQVIISTSTTKRPSCRAAVCRFLLLILSSSFEPCRLPRRTPLSLCRRRCRRLHHRLHHTPAHPGTSRRTTSIAIAITCRSGSSRTSSSSSTTSRLRTRRRPRHHRRHRHRHKLLPHQQSLLVHHHQPHLKHLLAPLVLGHKPAPASSPAKPNSH
jgi:hypothetical protein